MNESLDYYFPNAFYFIFFKWLCSMLACFDSRSFSYMGDPLSWICSSDSSILIGVILFLKLALALELYSCILISYLCFLLNFGILIWHPGPRGFSSCISFYSFICLQIWSSYISSCSFWHSSGFFKSTRRGTYCSFLSLITSIWEFLLSFCLDRFQLFLISSWSLTYLFLVLWQFWDTSWTI